MQQGNQQHRLFKTGSTIIAEDETTANLSPEEVRDILKYQYAEVANATINTVPMTMDNKLSSFCQNPDARDTCLASQDTHV